VTTEAQAEIRGAKGLEWLAVGLLAPYARNARTHSEEQVAQIAASIREFGFNAPVLVDETGTLIAGHGRLLAAQSIGMAAVPAVRIAHLTEAQRRAYVIADNQIALNAGWDEALLASELRELSVEGLDLDLLGFDADRLDELLTLEPDGSGGLTDPDETPEVEPDPHTQPGDVWLLGRHRIVCGDCTDAEAVRLALAGAKPHLMVTDPPYGVDYDPAWRDRAAPKKDGSKRADGKVLNDDRDDWAEAWALFPGAVAYVWHGHRQVSTMQRQLEACDFDMRAHIIWGKSRLVLGRGHYHAQHESCWYAVRRGATGHWRGDRSQTTLWSIDTNRSNDTGHGTQKPIDCMKRPIENNSLPGDTVYEPFSGSGTTLIAAEMTGRRCLALELSPAYVDVAVRRWQNFTGQQAVLERTGEPFPVGPAMTAP
jgi:DNA modification methylase